MSAPAAVTRVTTPEKQMTTMTTPEKWMTRVTTPEKQMTTMTTPEKRMTTMTTPEKPVTAPRLSPPSRPDPGPSDFLPLTSDLYLDGRPASRVPSHQFDRRLP
jgi:hypothetical protein